MIHKLYICYTVKIALLYEIIKFFIFFSSLTKNSIDKKIK